MLLKYKEALNKDHLSVCTCIRMHKVDVRLLTGLCLFILVSAETLNSKATFSSVHSLHRNSAGAKGHFQEQ